MACLSDEKVYETTRQKILVSSAELFLKKGFAATKLREIEENANVERNDLIRIFGNKENILAALVQFVLDEQFNHAMEKTDDKILFYAAETAMQIHLVEYNENLRELYSAAYSLPNTTHIIQETITKKLEYIFKEHLPHYDTSDFYMLEIASGGIMRGFMTIPCNIWFTMDKKIKAFIETTFAVYKVSDEKIKEAIEFVAQFDFKKMTQTLVQSILEKIKTEI